MALVIPTTPTTVNVYSVDGSVLLASVSTDTPLERIYFSSWSIIGFTYEGQGEIIQELDIYENLNDAPLWGVSITPNTIPPTHDCENTDHIYIGGVGATYNIYVVFDTRGEELSIVNKVVVNDVVRIDLTADTVTPQTLLKGYTAHHKSGLIIEGMYEDTGIHPSGNLIIEANGDYDITQYASVNVALPVGTEVYY